VKVTITVDGQRREVEVDLARQVVRLGGAELAFRVVNASGGSVELEVAGERVKVDDWPSGRPSPDGPVTVDGERYAVRAEVYGGAEATAAPAPTAASAAPAAGADAIVPPMPGKVVEVRVREGEPVRQGAVLLVLEAMKMRNEVRAPRDGVVRGLRVAAGDSVRSRETMLTIAGS
jgi:glutaconyl-CoA decarboxylase